MMDPIVILGWVGGLLIFCGSIGTFIFSKCAVADWPATKWSEDARFYADMCFVIAMLGATALICSVLSAANP